MSALSRFRPDEFTIAMLATVMLGFLLPCRGTSAGIFDDLAAIAIGLLFFFQGARLSRVAIIAGALHWRLHLVIFAATFVLFPVVGLAFRPLSGTLLTPALYLGLLFLCTLPSTVQDSVAFTSSRTLPLRQRVRAHAREGTSSASLWTGTRVPRNTGFPLMILPFNRSLVGARAERISSARAPEMCPFEKQSKNIKTVRRKLAAIFAADVAGYSRLMARDA